MVDLDVYMWSFEFEEFQKCPGCGNRLDFSASNPAFKVKRKTPDIFSTYDLETIASDAFKIFCEKHRLVGAQFTVFQKDCKHLHLIGERRVVVDVKRSQFQLIEKCGVCGNFDTVITKGNPMWLSVPPDSIGFYRTDLMFGGGNRKTPIMICNEITKDLLKGSGLTGFREFEPVYGNVPAPAAAESEIPLVTISSLPSKPNQLDTSPLEMLAAHPAPGFLCKNRYYPGKPLIVAVEHRLGPMPSKVELQKAKRKLGRSHPQVLEFYNRHNGLELYAQPGTDNVGVRFAPLHQWGSLTKESLGSLISGEATTEYIAIGEVPGSGNYFVLPLRDNSAGEICLINHEGGDLEPFADDLNHFFHIISEEPVDLLRNVLGSYIRYSSPESKDWLPEKYYRDIHSETQKRRGRRSRPSKNGSAAGE